jgi:hypothetical protein
MPAAALQALGVRRYSAGAAIAQTLYGLAAAMMREFTTTGRIDNFGVEPIAYAALNVVMAR